MTKYLMIRSSSAEFYNTSKHDVGYHLKNIFETFELEESSTIKEFLNSSK